MTPFRPPGIYSDMHATDYHADPGASASRLKMIALRSPLHLRQQLDNPEPPTHDMILGTLVHQVLMEPGQPLPQLAVVPETFTVPADYVPKSKKDVQPGEVVEWSFRRKHCQQWRRDNDQEGRIVVTRDELDGLFAAAKAVAGNEFAASLFNDAGTEVSMFWNTTDGFRCKARLDLIPRRPCLADVKYTNDASLRAFGRQIISMGYYIQAAWYRMAWRVLGDDDRAEFFFIAIERGTHAISVHQVSEDLLRKGEDAALSALDRWTECQRSGVWPGYPTGINVVDAPPWLVGGVGEP